MVRENRASRDQGAPSPQNLRRETRPENAKLHFLVASLGSAVVANYLGLSQPHFAQPPTLFSLARPIVIRASDSYWFPFAKG